MAKFEGRKIDRHPKIPTKGNQAKCCSRIAEASESDSAVIKLPPARIKLPRDMPRLVSYP